MEFSGFRPSIFEFLEQLAEHNDRVWFERNKPRYETEVREPCLAFIRAFRPRLKRISELFEASDRRVGGSLLRIYRDTRFSKDKTPYKTNVGIQFRHRLGRDIHAPGFYVHIEPGACFLALGVWRPDPTSLAQIRQAIVEHPDRWRRATRQTTFRDHLELVGDSLKRPPRGFPADHPLIEDLKRTDLLGYRDLTEREVLAPTFLDGVDTAFRAGRPLVRFLCQALGIPF